MDTFNGMKKNTKHQSNENDNGNPKINEELKNHQKLQSADKHNDNSLVANAIKYYKCLSIDMESKIKSLELAIKNYRTNNATLKQNIMDMQNEKQKLLSEFHENYRKFNQITECENRLECEVEGIAGFLEQQKVLKNEIFDMKMKETRIRNYIVMKFQTNYEELEKIENNYATEIQCLKDKVDEIRNQQEVYEKLYDEMGDFIQRYDDVLNVLKWNIRNENIACEETKNETNEIERETRLEIFRQQEASKNNVIKAHQSIYSMKHQFMKLKVKLDNNYQIKTMIKKLQKKLSKNISKKNEIEKSTEIILSAIKVLREENDKCKIRLQELENDIHKSQNEKEILVNTLENWKMKIADEQSAQNNFLATKQLHEENIKHAVTEIEKLKQEETVYSLKTDLDDKQSVNENLKKEVIEYEAEKNLRRNKIINLKTDVAVKEKEINELKKNVLSKNIYRQDDSEPPDQQILNAYLAIEYEEKAMYEATEFELNKLFEKVSDLQPYAEQMEQTLQEYVTESDELDEAIISNETKLQKIVDNMKAYENSIQVLKQNVYQGKYVTQQDLNKKMNVLINGVKTEQTAIEKLREEISRLSLETNKKRPLYAPESGRRLSFMKPMRSKKDRVPKQMQKVVSPDGDVYTFK